MMGKSAAFDMARSEAVTHVTVADQDGKLAKKVAEFVTANASKGVKVVAAKLDAADQGAAEKLMSKHDGTLSCVPYFFNLGLAKAAVKAGRHFADLGGNNTVVRQTLALAKKAEKRGIALSPDCGLSPGMASILAGDLFRRITAEAKKPYVDALRLYVGGLPAKPKAPWRYQLVFSVEGLINEYSEPARVLKGGKLQVIEPLTEPEDFDINGFERLVAFHTSGGTSTMPETFEGKVGECFEKTLRYPEHFPFIRGLYDLGLFSSEPRKINGHKLAPRAVMCKVFEGKFASKGPDLCIMRLEAHESVRAAGVRGLLGGRLKGQVAAFTMVDHYDPKTDMSAMMRTTAFPASIIVQMLASGAITKRGGVLQERDVPADMFLEEMGRRGIKIDYSLQ